MISAKQLTINFPEELYERLTEKAKGTYTTRAEIVRQAVLKSISEV